HPIGQGSVWKSLVHLYAAEYVWLETLLGDDEPLAPGDLPKMIPGNQQGELPIAGIEELKQKWLVLDARWSDYLTTLVPDRLDDMVPKKVSLTGQLFVTRRSDILLHVCTHSQYTTAQIMNMLRQAGVSPLPEVMLILMARLENS
ncbi:MAG TPA: DinB family protein, partial [Schlesneria sp.]